MPAGMKTESPGPSRRFSRSSHCSTWPETTTITSSWSGCLWKLWPLPGFSVTSMTVRSFAPVLGGLQSQRSWPQSRTSGVTSERMTNLPGMGTLLGWADGLEGAGLFGEGPLDRQALHGGGAVEAVAGRACSRMEAASAGSAIGPPWQRTMTSSRSARAAAAMASISATQSSSDLAEVAPMVPPVVTPMWATTMSAPARVIAAASSGLKT